MAISFLRNTYQIYLNSNKGRKKRLKKLEEKLKKLLKTATLE